MRTYSDIAVKDKTKHIWHLKEEVIFYLSHFDGFTARLWHYCMAVDKQFNYNIQFRSFKISYAKKDARTFIELKGIIPENICNQLTGLYNATGELLPAYSPHKYTIDDIGCDSYLINTPSGTANITMEDIFESASALFVNQAEKQLYELHMAVREWINALLKEAEDGYNPSSHG